MSDETPESLSTLLDLPSPAVLTTYRADGSAVSSPVWFRSSTGNLEVVIAEDDVKLRHLEHRARCSILVFETVPPFRGLRVDGVPTLRPDGVDDARLAIASRYLGIEDGERFAAARGPGVLLSMPLDHARAWNLAQILP